uniref:DNA polymerase III subunit alpha n=1 Tax=Streptomyces sp. YIM 98790 TaxID=2689077 RepID=UPI00140BD849
VRGGAHVDEPPLRVVLLARDRAGWAALCRMISAAHAAEGPPVVSWEALRAHATPALMVLLGPVSEPVRALSAGRPDLAARLLAPWRELFGDSLRLEAVWHGRTGTGPGSLRLAARTLGLAAGTGVPAVLANAVRYADPEQHRMADVLDSARRLVPIVPGATDSGERWLKGPREMAEAAGEIARAAGGGEREAARLLAATAQTARACLIDPQQDLGMGRPHFPEPEVVGTDAASLNRALRERCEAGLARRGVAVDPPAGPADSAGSGLSGGTAGPAGSADSAGTRGPGGAGRPGRFRRSGGSGRSGASGASGASWRQARERLDQELSVIADLGYAGYFLTVAAVVADTRELGIRVAARGSGAGSLVNYALDISNVNPLEHELIFERFLSRRRSSLPDIDLDVESARRLEVYRAVLRRFGERRIAMVAMPETYRARHAVRDTAAALGMDPDEADWLAKSFPHIRARDLRAAVAELPELRRVAARGDRYDLLWELAEGLDGLVRGTAMHPCGVIISHTGLLDRLPVQPTAQEGFPMVQADKEDVELWGLLKLDILGVRLWSSLAHATAEIERVSGERIDLEDPAQVPPEDPAAFALIRRADTLGLFQLESPGQRDLLSRLQPATFADIVADISLFRPGPVAGDMPGQYVASRHGKVPPVLHADLEELLRASRGVVIWHEQVTGIMAAMTGRELDEAEEMRRGLADTEGREEVRAWFMAHAAARGHDGAVCREIWKVLEAFGAYGFCRAHATAFAAVSVQSAWLKAHRAAALYAGLLEHDPGMWPRRVLLADARRHDVPILPVDVNRSDTAYRLELVSGKWGVRMSLSQVENIAGAEAARIAAGQPYTSLDDFWRRARPSRPTAERLARIGALGAFGSNRRDLLLHIAELHHTHRAAASGGGRRPARRGERRGEQEVLAVDAGGPRETEPAGLPDLGTGERLEAELQVLGMDTSRHLMEDHAGFLTELGVVSAQALHSVPKGRTVLVAGVKAATQTPAISSGKRIIFLTLDAGDGLIDLAAFEDSHPACAHAIFHSGLLLARGTVQRRAPGATSVVCAAAWDLAELIELRRTGGLDAVAARLAEDEGAPEGDGTGAGRRIRMPTGAVMHPWSDLRPAGDGAAPVRRLWHSSPGSAG